MNKSNFLRTTSAALLSVGLMGAFPLATAIAADGETSPDCAAVVKQADSTKYQRAIVLQADSNGKMFVSDLSQQTRIVKQDDKSVTVRVPVTFYDRNKNGEFDGGEIYHLVPGAQSEGALQICNNGKTQKAILNASIVNAVTEGDVTNTKDPFYNDVLVNGKSFASYVGKDSPLIVNKTIKRGDTEKVELKYSFDFDATSGNKAGPAAHNVKTGEVNEYEAGSRIASVDIAINLVGVDDPIEKEPDKGVVTGTAVDETNTLLLFAVALAAGLGVAGGYIVYNKKKVGC